MNNKITAVIAILIMGIIIFPIIPFTQENVGLHDIPMFFLLMYGLLSSPYIEKADQKKFTVVTIIYVFVYMLLLFITRRS